jgi:hypothetical protein
MQEISDSIKTTKQRIMGIKEEVQAKGIHNIFNKTTTKNFPNLEKVLAIQVQKASRTPNGQVLPRSAGRGVHKQCMYM